MPTHAPASPDPQPRSLAAVAMASLKVEQPEPKPEVTSDSKKRKAEAPVAVDSLAKKRILKELMVLSKLKQRETEQLELEVIDENDIMRWRAKWYYDKVDSDSTETERRLKEQLTSRGLEFIEFRLVFSDEYPRAPPMVYSYYPRLIGSYIFSAGGICAATLNQQHGWTPASRAQSLMIAVRAMLQGGGCRLQSDDPKCAEHANTEEGARGDTTSIARIHASGYSGGHMKS